MNHRPRFVFDTSVLVSAAMIEDSKPAEAFRKARETGEILTSTATAAELNEVLDRDRLQHYISRQNRERFLVAFVREATSLTPMRYSLPVAIPRMTSSSNWPWAARRPALSSAMRTCLHYIRFAAFRFCPWTSSSSRSEESDCPEIRVRVDYH